MGKDRAMSELLRFPDGGTDIRSLDARSTPAAGGGDEASGRKLQEKYGERLADLQELFYANGRTGDMRSVLLVLQGLDTSGKGGTIGHVLGWVDPQGTQIASFKAPTPEEQRHDFLWRVRRRLPEPGIIGVFDRSHYEDVLVVRVRNLAASETWARRYDAINRFEKEAADNGTMVLKCYLHISFDAWRERQLARLDNPKKHWKFNPGDVDDAALWNDFLDAYQDMLERCSTDAAPWYVIPSDHKWHRNLAVTRLLVEHLEGFALDWPQGDFDVAAQRERVKTVQSP